jgi:DNA-binding transcriptional ArsR family regulator
MLEGDADIASVATLLSDETRASMLAMLANGHALPAGELARTAGVSAGTASEHLAKLTQAGWLSVEKNGRHRYYRISRPEVLQVVESLAGMATVRPVHSLHGSRVSKALRLARTCYDHLAGRVGVAVFESLQREGGIARVDGQWTVRADAAIYRELGLPAAALRGTGRRPPVRACLDWSERRHHLAGTLGAVMLRHLGDQGWCTRAPNDRSVAVTEAGWSGLRDQLGIEKEDLLAGEPLSGT